MKLDWLALAQVKFHQRLKIKWVIFRSFSPQKKHFDHIPKWSNAFEFEFDFRFILPRGDNSFPFFPLCRRMCARQLYAMNSVWKSLMLLSSSDASLFFARSLIMHLRWHQLDTEVCHSAHTHHTYKKCCKPCKKCSGVYFLSFSRWIENFSTVKYISLRRFSFCSISCRCINIILVS